MCRRLTAVLMLLFLPTTAWAQNLTCSQTLRGSPVPGTSLFGVYNCNGFGPANVFSGLNCQFQLVLNDVMSAMYCGLQYQLMPLLAICLTLYVIVYAIAFTFGIAELTARELATRLIKIALIWAFAMNASWGVGLAFNALVGSIETASTWALRVIYPNITGRTIFLFLDQILYDQITGPFTASSAMLMGFILGLSYALFPLFCLFMYLLIKVIGVLIRTLISYLLGLTLIAFLIALGPLFVSFALFQVTYHFFESWLRYLISMALQIIIVFAAVAVWLYVMSLFGSFFTNLLGVLRYYDHVFTQGSVTQVVQAVGVCTSTLQFTPFGYRLLCTDDGIVVPPTALMAFPAFIWFLFSNLITLCIIVYAFDTLIKQIPELAVQLAGPRYTPKIFGGTGPQGIQVPGIFGPGKIKQAQNTFLKAGLGSVYEKLPTIKHSAIDNFKEQAAKLLDRDAR